MDLPLIKFKHFAKPPSLMNGIYKFRVNPMVSALNQLNVFPESYPEIPYFFRFFYTNEYFNKLPQFYYSFFLHIFRFGKGGGVI